MVKLMDCLKRFARNEDGAFIVLFGVMAVVLTALSGAVVDYTRMQEQRNRAQIALDSAALALQADIFSRSAEDIRADAERLVRERAGTNSNVWVDQIAIDTAAGSLTLTGGLDVPMLFVRLVGVENLTAAITSQATRRKLRLEVAMVLDNSGSMLEQNRMDHLKQAATNAVNILFDGEAVHNDVFMSVVPYTYHVNIGADNVNQFWIDRGESRLSGDNFRFDTGTINWINAAGRPIAQKPHNFPVNSPLQQNNHVDRIWLYDRINNESWRGCVEARPHPLDVMDTPPRRGGALPPDDSDVTAINPGLSWRETLFVPLFAPDLPDRLGTSNNGTYLQYVTNDRGGVCQTPHPANNSSGDFEAQERICKYIGVNISNSGDFRGPNVDCGQPLLPLTNVRQPILNSINAMVASGGTNIHMGAMWGWHVLSPNEPFPAEEYDDEDVSKVMILMTDGENTPYEITTNNANNPNGSWLFSAYGHPVNNQRAMTDTRDRIDGFIRLGKRLWNRAQLKAEMDRRLEQTCTNAKDAGIRIYSIGLSVSAQADRDRMARCATSSQDAYFTNNPSELNAVFEEIADQLSSLRLSM